MKKWELLAPAEIERRSFEIIRQGLLERGIAQDPEEEPVLVRCIHTSADFDYAGNLVFSRHAVSLMRDALRRGADIVTDTEMARAGINKKRLSEFGGVVRCFMSDPEVAEEAKRRGVTRATVSMERAAELGEPCIFAVGNAPTALIRLRELMDEGRVRPAGIIAVPVGFVNVVEAKELIIGSDCPHIAARGRKGGSNIAAAVCNALLYGM